jgi:hypothetical protein
MNTVGLVLRYVKVPLPVFLGWTKVVWRKTDLDHINKGTLRVRMNNLVPIEEGIDVAVF